MKASLQGSSAPAKGWGTARRGHTAAQGGRQRQPSGASSLRPGPGRPPWRSLQGCRSGRVTRVRPAGQEGRVLPGKLKESGRVERSFVWKSRGREALERGDNVIIRPCKQQQGRRSPLARAPRPGSPPGFTPCSAGQGELSCRGGGLSSFICLFLTSKTKLFPFCSYFLCWFSLESGLVLILVPGACLPGKLQRGKLSLERFQACAFVAEGLETSHSRSVVLQGDLQPEQERAGLLLTLSRR